jgi:hypothetical protein
MQTSKYTHEVRDCKKEDGQQDIRKWQGYLTKGGRRPQGLMGKKKRGGGRKDFYRITVE